MPTYPNGENCDPYLPYVGLTACSPFAKGYAVAVASFAVLTATSCGAGW
jgi:hypothetical protein